jgi:flavin-dependent dehydrogenase
MKVGIVGAGPAGSLCASILSKAGSEVLLFDYRGAWEKPCGGGVTSKALLRYPFLIDCVKEKRHITHVRVISPKELKLTVPLQDPLLIYSRNTLNGILLEKAASEGARFLEERILDFQRQNSYWQLKTQKSNYRVDFLVGADGVNSLVRKRLSNRFASQDLMMTYGYRVPADGQDVMEIKFFRNLLGYLWVFARPGNISFGICGRLSRNNTSALKRYLHEFLEQNYSGTLSVSGSKFQVSSCQTQQLQPTQNSRLGTRNFDRYSALIPSLRASSFRNNEICGQGWALVGDAAGFADPITCEGIYYALRSGELLANTLIESRPDSYPDACKRDFVEDFIHAAELFEKFYLGNFLGADFVTRMVQSTSRSRALQSVMNSFIAGRQDYKSLRRKLIQQSPRILFQIMGSAFT